MHETTQRHRTRSAGTKLTQQQYADIKAKADAQGLGVSEYLRDVLFEAPLQLHYIRRLEVLCQVQLAETMALRSLVVNLASVQAAGENLTPERLDAIRTHADAGKAARASVLLSEATSNQAQAELSKKKNEEAG